MPGFGYSSEFLLIFIVALMVFGPKRLPELAKSLGRAMNEFKRSMNEFKNQIESEVGADRIKEDLLRQVDFKPSGQPVQNKIETEEDYVRSGQAEANKASAPSGPATNNKAKAEPAPHPEDGRITSAANEPAGQPASSEDGLPALPPKKTDA
ncbi:MAG: Sec-independent protein translocase protein TatB [Nitrospirota bacterium]